ncbi:MAG: transglycosylase SLT domain-containing protein [Mailhella sp.]|nr:transglycosylase SLT domain-containing protein [Mailhella sp.]
MFGFIRKYHAEIASLLINLQIGLIFLIGCLLMFEKANAKEAPASLVPQKAYKYREFLIKESRIVWGLTAPSATFASQIHTESLWNEQAKSFAGAEGLAQFMPETALWIGSVYIELENGAPYNPKWAIRALVRYNKWHFDKIRAVDLKNKMAFTLSAYNGGLGWVLKDKKKAEAAGLNPYAYFGNVEKMNAGRSKRAFTENRNYVTFIKSRESAYMEKGFGNGAF